MTLKFTEAPRWTPGFPNTLLKPLTPVKPSEVPGNDLASPQLSRNSSSVTIRSQSGPIRDLTDSTGMHVLHCIKYYVKSLSHICTARRQFTSHMMLCIELIALHLVNVYKSTNQVLWGLTASHLTIFWWFIVMNLTYSHKPTRELAKRQMNSHNCPLR